MSYPTARMVVLDVVGYDCLQSAGYLAKSRYSGHLPLGQSVADWQACARRGRDTVGQALVNMISTFYIQQIIVAVVVLLPAIQMYDESCHHRIRFAFAKNQKYKYNE